MEGASGVAFGVGGKMKGERRGSTGERVGDVGQVLDPAAPEGRQKGVDGVGGDQVRRKDLERRGAREQWRVREKLKEDGRRGRGRDPGPWGREFSQPHQLQPLFEFNEWILASEAKEAETYPPPPCQSPHSSLTHIPKSSCPTTQCHRGPSRPGGGGTKGVGNRAGCKRGVG